MTKIKYVDAMIGACRRINATFGSGISRHICSECPVDASFLRGSVLLRYQMTVTPALMKLTACLGCTTSPFALVKSFHWYSARKYSSAKIAVF